MTVRFYQLAVIAKTGQSSLSLWHLARRSEIQAGWIVNNLSQMTVNFHSLGKWATCFGEDPVASPPACLQEKFGAALQWVRAP